MLLLITVVRVYCCTRKMLKDTETEETMLFCHIFIIGGISIWGGSTGPPAPSPIPTTPMAIVL